MTWYSTYCRHVQQTKARLHRRSEVVETCSRPMASKCTVHPWYNVRQLERCAARLRPKQHDGGSWQQRKVQHSPPPSSALPSTKPSSCRHQVQAGWSQGSMIRWHGVSVASVPTLGRVTLALEAGIKPIPYAVREAACIYPTAKTATFLLYH